MPQAFDEKVQDFLNKKKPGTRKIYASGLAAFQEFYPTYCKDHGLEGSTIPDFLDRIQTDRNLGWRETKNVVSNVGTAYVAWLKQRFKRKSVRAYTGAVQQLAKYYNLPFSTRDMQLPASNPELKKYPWTVDEVARFLNLFDSPMYKAYGVLIFQSFLDDSTTLKLQYQDIEKEYTKGTCPLCLDAERIKTEIPFCSFIGTWGLQELHNYLDNKSLLQKTDDLFPVSEQSVDAYFRDKAEVFLGKKFEKNERSPCAPHSLRASGSTLSRDNAKGDAEQVRAVDRYIDFFMGKAVEEQKRVYMSKSREGWRETWKTRVEPFVTPKFMKARIRVPRARCSENSSEEAQEAKLDVQ